MRRTHLEALALLALSCGMAAQAPSGLLALDESHRLVRLDPLTGSLVGAVAVPFVSASMPFADDLAWDATTGHVRVLVGQVMQEVDVTTGALVRGPTALSGTGTCMSLTVEESADRIWLFDVGGLLHTSSLAWPPQPTAVCSTNLVVWANHRPTGLALDELRSCVFYCARDLVAGQDIVRVAAASAPCTALQQLVVPHCPGTSAEVSGIAVDATRGILYVCDFDGYIVSWDYSGAAAGALTFTQRPCLVAPVGLYGIAVTPGGATTTGTACANGSALCGPVTALGSDPVLGNAHFRIDVGGADPGALCWCVVGAGPCVPGGTGVPPLCGPVMTPIPLGVLGPVTLAGAAGCTGAASIAFPLPLHAGLRGVVLGAQPIVLHLATAGAGTALGPCLSFELQGS